MGFPLSLFGVGLFVLYLPYISEELTDKSIEFRENYLTKHNLKKDSVNQFSPLSGDPRKFNHNGGSPGQDLMKKPLHNLNSTLYKFKIQFFIKYNRLKLKLKIDLILIRFLDKMDGHHILHWDHFGWSVERDILR